MDKKIESLKKAMENGDVKASKDVDLNEAKNILTDPETKFTHLGTHYTKPGKLGEYIYMVASFTAPEKGSDLPDRNRTWGWVKTEKEAREAVACNAGDMFEMEYLYTVIEKLASGIFCVESEQVAWFAWLVEDIKKPQNGKWVEIPQPEWAKGTVNWTL